MARLVLPVLLAAVLALAACGSEDAGGGSGPEAAFEVVATTTHAADFVRSVGGARVAVTGLIPPGADAHDHEVRPDDVRAVADADLVVRSGGDVDEWLGEVLEAAGADAPVLTLIDHVDALRDGDEVDPHWWQDPRNVERAVRAIQGALARADAAGATVYAENAAAYARQVRALDRAAGRCLAAVPAAQRKLVTTHDAYGAFARRYDVTVVGAVIPSRSTQAQPSAGETAELVATIRREGVRTVFAESAVPARVERAIAEQAGARVGPALWADTLGGRGSGASTWLEAFAADVRALVEGFTAGRARCAFPE